jgi:hypothetical protein
MSHTTYEERMALRNKATMDGAQRTFDAMAEPLMPDDAAELAGWAEHLTYLANDVLQTIGRAERCIGQGNLDAARDMLTCVAKMVGDQ